MQKQASPGYIPFKSSFGRHVGRLLFAVWRSLIFTPVFLYTRARAHSPRTARAFVLGIVWLALLACVGTSLFRPAQTVAATDSTVNFQARLETNTGSIVPDGTYNVEFKIYNASSGGSPEWTEDWLNNAGHSVTVVNGYLTVNLGSVTAFSGINWDQQQWLTMNIGNTNATCTPFSSCVPDGEMSPRLSIGAVPYAFRAGELADPANSGSTLTWAVQGSSHSLLLPNEAGTLCVQTSANCGFATGSGSAFLQNGNSFGTQAVLGTKDGNSLAFLTNNTNKLILDTSGNLTFQQASTLSTGANTLAVTSSNFTVTTGGVLNVIGGSAGYQIGGAATTGNYLRGNGTSFVSSAIQPADIPVCSGTCNYISNQTGVQTSSNFNISANGTIGGNLVVAGTAHISGSLSTDNGGISGTSNSASATAPTGIAGGVNNMAINSSFEAGDLTGWTSAGTWAIDSTNSKYGSDSAEATGNGATQQTLTSTCIPVDNTDYALSTWAKSNDGLQKGYFGLKYYSDTSCTTLVTNNYPTTMNATNVSTSWTRYYGIINPVTQSGSTLAVRIFLHGSYLTAGNTWFDGIQFERGTVMTAWKAANTDRGSGSQNLFGIGAGDTVEYSPLTNSVATFQIQNAAGTADIFTVDTTHGKIGTQDQTAASTNSTALVLQSGNATGTTSSSGNVTLDSGTGTTAAGSVSIGTGAYAHNVTIGNTSSTSAVTIQGGTGALTLTPTGIGTIVIGAAAGTGNITLGSSSAAQTVLIGNGTGASTVSIANNVATATGNTVNIAGGATATGMIDTVNIATGNTVLTGAKAVHIADGTPGGTGANTVTIGSSANASAVTLNAGTGNINLQAGTIVGNATTQNLFNTVATTLNIGGAVGAGGIVLAGGSGSTGCTLDGSTGNLACTGTITSSGGAAVGYWSRSGAILQPATAGDAITTTGNISTTSAGTITSAGLLTGSAGLTVTGAGSSLSGGIINLNASSNFATNINTGTSTGTVAIGNTTNATAITLQSSTSISLDGAAGTTYAIGASSVAGTIAIGGTAGTGNITLGSSSGTQSVFIGNGAGLSTVSIGNATTVGSTVNIATAANTVADGVNIASGNNSAVSTLNIGTGNTSVAGGKTIHIGDGTPTGTNLITIGSIAATANTTTIQGGNGAGAVSVQAATSGTISIGTANANTLSIGNTTAGTVINERVGTSYSLDGVAASTYALGATTTTGTITIGGAAQTGAITLGSSTGAGNVLIGNGTGASTVSIANNVATATGNTVNIAGGATATGMIDTVNIATGNTVLTGAKAVHIADGTPGGTGANTVTIGSTANASSTTIQGGTGNINLVTNSASAGVIVKANTDSTTAFQVQASNTSPIFNVDTTDTNLLAGLDAGFESSPLTSWVGKGTGSVARSTAQKYTGNASGAVTTTAAAGSGIQVPFTFSTGTQYTLSLYARLSSGAMSTFVVGHQDVTGTDINCLTGQTLSNAGWTRFTCTFTTGGTITSSNIYVDQSDAVARAGTIFIDSVQLQTGANTNAYGGGNIQTNATVTSSLALQNTSDSTTAFTIQNASGSSNLFTADTLNGLVKIGVSSGGVANALQFAGGTAPALSLAGTGNIYYDSGSTTFKVSVNGGAYSSLLTSGNVFLQGGNSFSAQAELGTNDAFALAFRTNNADRLILSTTGNLQFQQASTINNVAAASGTQLTVKGGDATTPNNVGGNLLLQGGAGAGSGASGSVIIQSNVNNSTTALAVENAIGANILTVDTTDSNLITNPGFEIDASGWSGKGTGGAISRVTSGTIVPYLGVGSGQVTTSSTANAGASFNYAFSPTTTYTLSFYARVAAGTAKMTTLNFGRQDVSGTDVDCATGQTLQPTGWARYSCTFTTGGTITSSNLYVKDTGTSHTLYLDSVQLEANPVATPYGAGGLTLNGTVNSPLNIRNASDSTTNFQVQNAAASATLFNIDTTANANDLVSNGSFEANTTGWAAKTAAGTITLNLDDTQATTFGQSDLKVVTSGTLAALDGIKFPVSLNSATLYGLSFWVKVTSGSASNLSFGRADNGATDTACSTSSTASATLWLRFSCTFTTGTTSGSPYIFIGFNDTNTARTFYVDGVDLESTASLSAAYYKDGKISLGSSAITSPVLIQNTANSNAAFVVANALGNTGLQVDTNGGALNTNFATTVNNTLTASTVSTAIFRVRNSTSGGVLINADNSVPQTGNNSNAINNNASFENGTTGWAVNHASGEVAQATDTTTNAAGVPNAYTGATSLKVTSTGTSVANTGTKYTLTTTTLPSTTTFTLSFYAKLVAGQSAFTTLAAGRADNGATETACTLNANTVSFSWQRFTCTFTTGTTSSTPYIFIGQSDASVIHSYFLDGVSLENTSSVNANNFREGRIQLNGDIISPTIFRPQSDSPTAFQLQNSNGGQLLVADTTTVNNDVNGSVETGIFGYTAIGTGTTIAQTTSQAYVGTNSLQVSTTGSSVANDGVHYNNGTTTIATGIQYTLSFYAKIASGSFTTLVAGRADNGATNTGCTLSGTTVTTVWQRYTCTFTAGTVSGTPYIYIGQSDAAVAHTYFLDGIQLEANSSATPYKEGELQINGIINSALVLQNTNDSTTALQVQNAAGTNLLVVDTVNSQLTVGSTAGASATILQAGTAGVKVSTGASGSTTAFQVQNAAGTAALFNVDNTANLRVTVGNGGTGAGQLYVTGSMPSAAISTTSIAASGPQDVAVNGRYMYVAEYTTSKLGIYDVTNPASPALIGTALSLGGQPQGIAVAGKYVYVAEFTGSKLQIVDVSNPNAPSIVGTVSTTSTPNSVAVSGRYAYVATGTGVDVMDVSNPAAPFKLTGISLSLTTMSVFAAGRYVYATTSNNGTNAFMKVIDTATNTAVGSFNLSGGASGAVACSSNYGPRSVYVQGRYAFVANCGNASIDVFDVSNPTASGAAPTKTLSTGSAGPMTLFAQGRYLYAGLSTSGVAPSSLATYDISTISTMSQVGSSLGSNAGGFGLTVQGRYAYLANFGSSDVQIFDMGGAYVQQLEAGGIETGTLNVNGNASIAGNSSVTGGLNVGQSTEIGGSLSVGNNTTVMTNSNTAFQVQNTSGVSALNVDTNNLAVTVRAGTDIASLGSNLAPTNFSTGWTGTNWTLTSTTAAHNALATHTQALSPTTPLATTSGQLYQVSYTITNPTTAATTLTVALGATTIAFYNFDANTAGTYAFTDTIMATAPSTNANLTFTPDASGLFTGTISAVSVQAVTQNTHPVLVVSNVAGTANLEVRASSTTSNTFIGLNAGESNTSGNNNTAIGTNALQNNTTGTQNTALGVQALQNNTTGTQNLALGFTSLNKNTSGNYNTAIGTNALQANTTGVQNTAVGTSSLLDNTTGNYNTALGVQALQNNTTGVLNLALGAGSLNGNTTGDYNTAVGTNTLLNNTTGSGNTAIGTNALTANTTGSYSLAIGINALSANTTGIDNIGIGGLGNNSTGSFNVAIGDLHGNNGDSNTAIGIFSMDNSTGATGDTAIGYQALQSDLTGNSNIGLGSGADVLSGNLSNATAIGNVAQVGASNNIILGYSAANSTNYNVGIGTSFAPNELTVSPQTYGTNGTVGAATTITQGAGSGTVTGSSTAWTAAMVGGTIYYSNGTTGTITAVASGTSLTSSNTTGGWTTATYNIVWGGFNVSSTGTTLIQPTTDSTTAFLIKAQSNGGDVLTVDTTGSQSVGIGPGGASTTAKLYVTTGALDSFVANQTGSGALLRLQNSGTDVVNIGSAGAALFENSTNSTTAFQVQNAAGNSLIAVDTTTAAPIVNIGITGATALTSTVNIATSTGAIQTVKIGSNSNLANVTNIFGGNGTAAIALTPQTTGTIVIGAAAGTGAITLGASTAAQNINIGTGVNAGNNQTINVGTTASGGAGIKTINIGATDAGANGLNVVKILAGNQSGNTVANGSRAAGDTDSSGIQVSLGDRTSTTAVCSSLGNGTTVPTSGTAYELVDCSGTPVADYAEQYPVATGVQVGDVVATGTQMVNTYDTTNGNVDWTKVKSQITQLVKSDQPYQSTAIGIVSDNTGDFSSTGYNIKQEDNPMSVALNGRVPVNVTTENGPIEPGDYLTTSAAHPGYAMKATQAGYVIGQALAAYTNSDPGQVMTFVKNTYYPGPDMASMIQNGGDATLSNLTVAGNTLLANLDVAGDSTLSNLNVSGLSSLTNLSVTGDANVGGNLTVVGNTSIGGTLTVTGLTTVADITVNGHIITAGGQPTPQIQTAAGAVAANDLNGTPATATVVGNDTSGTITITTSDNPTVGDLLNIVFSKAYGAAPHILISGQDGKSTASFLYPSNKSTTGFQLHMDNPPQANTTYTFDYFIAQ